LHDSSPTRTSAIFIEFFFIGGMALNRFTSRQNIL